MMQDGRRRTALQRLRYGNCFQGGLPFQTRVQRVQERLPVIGIGLPAVLAVQDDRDQRIRHAVPARQLAALEDASHEVLGGAPGLPRHVREPDPIGELPVAENHAQRAGLGLHAVRLVQGARPSRTLGPGASERARQHGLVGGAPREPLGGQERERRLVHSSFRRPGPSRRGAESARVTLPSEPYLGRRVLRRTERRGRQRDRGRDLPWRVGRVQEREDRVVIRGRGYLDLPRGPGFAIHLDRSGGQRHTPVEERRLFVLGEPPAFREERPDRLLAAVLRIHPCEVEPGLEIANLLGRERDLAAAARPEDRGAALPQLAVPGIGLQHVGGIHAEEVPPEEALLFEGDFRRGTPGQLEVEIRVAPGDRVQLLEEDGRDVERGMNAGMAAERRHHVRVVLGRVEARPGEERAAGQRVTVGRLMHVPHQRETNGGRHG